MNNRGKDCVNLLSSYLPDRIHDVLNALFSDPNVRNSALELIAKSERLSSDDINSRVIISDINQSTSG
jgi:hypothetical protein